MLTYAVTARISNTSPMTTGTISLARPCSRGIRFGTRKVTARTYYAAARSRRSMAVRHRQQQGELAALAGRRADVELQPEALGHPADEPQAEPETPDATGLRRVGLGEVGHELPREYGVETCAGVLDCDADPWRAVFGHRRD